MSQAELGKRANLSASEISRIECGYKDVTEVEAASIAAALGMAVKVGIGLAKAGDLPAISPVVSQPETPTVPPVAAVADKPAAVGTDLADPASFGVLPDPGLLARGSLDESSFRTRLAAEIARANTILHTPRVPAPVWRAWRQFEQQAAAVLRSEVPPAPPVPVPSAVPVVQGDSARPMPIAAESKSLNSLLVEVGRELLAPDIAARITRDAEAARKADSSTGFMKHFWRIAEAELEPELLRSITEEAKRRFVSSDRSRARRGRGHSSAAGGMRG